MIIRAIVIVLAICTTCLAGQGMGPGPGLGPYGSGGGFIFDDFSSNTAANYVSIEGGISIDGGVAHNAVNWNAALLYHSTSTTSSDHYVEASVEYISGDESGIILRCNGTTGYLVEIGEQGIVLRRFSGSVFTFISIDATETLIANQLYKIRATVSGSTFHLYIDLNGDGDYLDSGEDLGTKNDATYTAGTYVGIYINRGSSGTDPIVDNLSGGSL